jgi:hypothetical protein
VEPTFLGFKTFRFRPHQNPSSTLAINAINFLIKSSFRFRKKSGNKKKIKILISFNAA